MAFMWLFLLPSLLPSMSSGEVYIANGYPGKCFVQTTEFETESMMVCSLQCARTRCLFFEFEDRTCQLHETWTDKRDPRKVRKYKPFYSATDVGTSDGNEPTLTNIAYKKTTAGAFTLGQYAVDHDLSTISTSSYYIKVDFSALYYVKMIRVLPLINWFADVRVLLWNTPTSYTIVGIFEGTYANASLGWLEFYPNGNHCGRYVELSAHYTFKIYEIEVLI